VREGSGERRRNVRGDGILKKRVEKEGSNEEM